jgi:hypothetical protein
MCPATYYNTITPNKQNKTSMCTLKCSCVIAHTYTLSLFCVSAQITFFVPQSYGIGSGLRLSVNTYVCPCVNYGYSQKSHSIARLSPSPSYITFIQIRCYILYTPYHLYSPPPFKHITQLLGSIRLHHQCLFSFVVC